MMSCSHSHSSSSIRRRRRGSSSRSSARSNRFESCASAQCHTRCLQARTVRKSPAWTLPFQPPGDSWQPGLLVQREETDASHPELDVPYRQGLGNASDANPHAPWPMHQPVPILFCRTRDSTLGRDLSPHTSIPFQPAAQLAAGSI